MPSSHWSGKVFGNGTPNPSDWSLSYAYPGPRSSHGLWLVLELHTPSYELHLVWVIPVLCLSRTLFELVLSVKKDEKGSSEEHPDFLYFFPTPTPTPTPGPTSAGFTCAPIGDIPPEVFQIVNLTWMLLHSLRTLSGNADHRHENVSSSGHVMRLHLQTHFLKLNISLWQ